MPVTINRAPKGSKLVVDPFREEGHIKAIKRLLHSKPRDLLLFVMGINNGLRAGDLLKIRVGQVRNLKVGETVRLIESKTGKANILMMNRSTYKALARYLEAAQPGEADFLFKSNKGHNQALTVSTVNQMVKAWARALNIPGKYGGHSLRKTFGYIQRVKYGVGWEVLAKRFNHSTPAVTMRYLGVSDEEVSEILLNEI